MRFQRELCSIKMSARVVWTESKRISQNQSPETWSLQLVKKFPKFRQLIFWGLLTAMLQCSAEAKQAPVDNHLLCGRRQTEVEQMAIVWFCCRGSLSLWIRNALVNAKLCGEWRSKLMPSCTLLLVREGGHCCVRAAIPEWWASSSHSLTCRARRWTSHEGISLPHSVPLVPSLTCSPADTAAALDERRFCCSRK